MEYQFKRQLIFGAALSVAIAGAALTGYYFLKPQATCNDRVQNQKEAGIDCGGPCAACRVERLEDIKILSYQSFLIGDGSYDAMAEIKNPNMNYGTGEFQYVFNFYNADKKLIEERSGKSFILAGQTRYVIENNIKLAEAAVFVDFVIKPEIAWEKQASYSSDLPVFSAKYESSGQGELSFAKVTGTLENKSGFDFGSVEVDVVLVGDNGRLIAVGKTNVDNLRFGESRLFTVLFHDKIPTPLNIYSKAITNLLDSANTR